MKIYLYLFIFFISFSACNNANTKVEREGEPDIYRLEEGDKEMEAAIEKAKATLDTFNVALGSNNENYSFFSLKKQFGSRSGFEHIWLVDIFLKDGEYYGVVIMSQMKPMKLV